MKRKMCVFSKMLPAVLVVASLAYVPKSFAHKKESLGMNSLVQYIFSNMDEISSSDHSSNSSNESRQLCGLESETENESRGSSDLSSADIPENPVRPHKVDFISTLLEKNRLQELIWYYRKRGKDDLAEEVKKILEGKLLCNKFAVRDRYIINNNKVKVEILDFGNGIQAMFKPDSVHSSNYKTWLNKNHSLADSRSELLAYQIDEMLGTNLVPMTLPFTLNKVKGTLQYLLPNQTPSEDDIYHHEFVNLKILDYIIDHTDRHGGNWKFIQDEQHIVAVNNGMSLRHKMKSDFTTDFDEREGVFKFKALDIAEDGINWILREKKIKLDHKMNPRVKEKILALNEEQLVRLLHSYGKGKLAPAVIKRVIKLKTYLQEI